MSAILLPDTIPAGEFRITVRWGGALFLVGIPTNEVLRTILEFEEFVGPALNLRDLRGDVLGADGCRMAARVAAGAADGVTVAAAALWLFLYEPGARAEGRLIELGHLVAPGGSAWLKAETDPKGAEWSFTLAAGDAWSTDDFDRPSPQDNPWGL
ncbi:hypothetical protein JL101_036040 (plasmid) [Skermanella rosea]|uniref:hypothetical protein n=1 Tax=Skermanella rosea TaxID=1817965 RepID=UPI001931E9F0|nr:hypothetical protein [Skermanella rosea]UEM08171.1 hypothetical protein JL101_036040 [Skermanella rosea]